MSCYKFFRLICGFRQIWWVTNVKVILWLLGVCCEAPGVILARQQLSVSFSSMLDHEENRPL